MNEPYTFQTVSVVDAIEALAVQFAHSSYQIISINTTRILGVIFALVHLSKNANYFPYTKFQVY